jgi:uncharacterized protein YjbJ (UPF0337 family)
MSMNEDRFAGTAKNVGGRVEQGFGRATGDMKTEVEGKMKQATGAAQELYGQAKDAAGDAYGQAKEVAGDAARSVQEHAAPMEEFLRNAIESRPYTSVAVALGVGWFIGRNQLVDAILQAAGRKKLLPAATPLVSCPITRSAKTRFLAAESDHTAEKGRAPFD